MKEIAIIVAFLVIAPAYVISNDSENLLKISIDRVRKISGEGANFSIIVNVEGEKWEINLNGYDLIIRTSKEIKIKDDKDKISISVEIFEGEKRGYITPDDGILNIELDTKRGEWTGDDFLKDEDGYAHASGCSDGKIDEYDYEIWFDITYDDYDNDRLTYWEEINIYHTDPYKSDYGIDYDNDGVAIEWEDKYGYNPFSAENHSLLDPDNDGLSNLEEYYMRYNLSNPFAKDIFIEIDYMPQYRIYNESIQMLYDAFSKHNITLHIEVDDALPYFERIYYKEARDFYWDYFLNYDVNNPKHGIYHYIILVAYGPGARGGNAFVGFDNCDSILLACQYINDWRIGEKRKIAYASLLMHELGHNLGLFEDDFGGIDNESCNAPWLAGYWKYANYKSCLNYRYSFELIDYSDGRNGINDFNDWDKIDLSFFKNSYYYE